MKCPECGYDTFTIEGLCYDRDGMRESQWCDECGIVYKSTAHGLVKKYRCIDYYNGKAKERIASLAEQILAEVTKKK